MSVVVYGRNDSHGYNLHKRASISFNCLAEVLSEGDEILFVDYNTPNDMPTFPEAIHDLLTPRCRAMMRVFRVRPAFHDRWFASRTHLKAIEPVSRNIAIRRASPRTRWILSTNTDVILLPESGAELAAAFRGLEDGYYGLPRFDIPETLWEGFDRLDPRGTLRDLRRYAKALELEEVLHAFPEILFDGPGDFQLMSRRQLHEIDAFHEDMILGWHLDSNIARRFKMLNGRLGDLLGSVGCFHCNHTRQATSLAHGPDFKQNDLSTYFFDLTGPAIPEQRDRWGFPEETFEEIGLDRRRGVFVDSVLGLAGPERGRAHAATIGDVYTDHVYPLGHVFPYLADYVWPFPRDATIGYAGVNTNLLTRLRGFLKSIGHEGELRVFGPAFSKGEAAEAASSGLPVFSAAEPMMDGASLMIFDFGVAIEADASAPDDSSSIARRTLGDVVSFFVECAEIERREVGSGRRAPMAFETINAINNPFEPLVKSRLLMVQTPMTTRCRHGVVRLRRSPDAAFAALRQALSVTMSRHGPTSRLRLGEAWSTTSATRGACVLAGTWKEPDAIGAWSVGRIARVRVPIEVSAGGPVSLGLRLSAFLEGSPDPMTVEAHLSGACVATVTFDRASMTNWLWVVADAPAGASEIEVTLHIHEPRSPWRFGTGREDLELGVRLERVRLIRHRTGPDLDEVLSAASDGEFSNHLVGTGWGAQEHLGVWTLGGRSQFRLTPPAHDGPLTISFDTDAYLVAGERDEQIATVRVDGVEIGEIRKRFGQGRGIRTLSLPPGCAGRSCLFEIAVAKPVVPVEIGLSDDPRALGLFVFGVKFGAGVQLSFPTPPIEAAPLEEALPDASTTCAQADGEHLSPSRAPTPPTGASQDRAPHLTWIGFADGAAGEPLLSSSGWSVGEAEGRWTDAETASIRLPVTGEGKALTLLVDADGFVVTDKNPMVTVDVFFDAHPVGRMTFGTGEAGLSRFELPAMPPGGGVLRFEVKGLARPCDIDLGPDDRRLGVFLRRIGLAEAAPPASAGDWIPIGANSLDRVMTVGEGWGLIEPEGCWSLGSGAGLRFRLPSDTPGPAELEVDAVPYLIRDVHDRVDVDVLQDGVLVRSVVFSCDRVSKTMRIPVRGCGGDVIDLKFLVRDPVTPADVSESTDRRHLGLLFRRVRLLERFPSLTEGEWVGFGEAERGTSAAAADDVGAPEAEGCWSEGPDLRLRFKRPDMPRRAALEIDAAPLLVTAVREASTVDVRCDGASIGRLEYGGRHGLGLRKIDLPTLAGGEVEVSLHVTDVRSPKELRISEDARELGLFLRRMRVRESLPEIATGVEIRVRDDHDPRIEFREGWHAAEATGRWTIADRAVFRLRAPEVSHDLRLLIEAMPCLPPELGRTTLSTAVFVNGETAETLIWEASEATALKAVTIPAGCDREVEVELAFLDRPTPTGSADHGLGLFVAGLRLEKAAQKLLRGVEVSFGREDHGVAALHGAGWGEFEPEGAWTVGERAELRLDLGDPPERAALLLWAGPYLPDVGRSRLVVRPSLDGVRLEPLVFRRGEIAQPSLLKIPAGMRGTVTLTLNIENPQSPRDLGLSPDPRRLGVFVRRVRLTSAAVSLATGETASAGVDGFGLLLSPEQGWTQAEETGVWMAGRGARFEIAIPDAGGDLAIAFDGVASSPSVGNGMSRLSVFANGRRLGSMACRPGGVRVTGPFVLPAGLSGVVAFELRLEDALHASEAVASSALHGYFLKNVRLVQLDRTVTVGRRAGLHVGGEGVRHLDPDGGWLAIDESGAHLSRRGAWIEVDLPRHPGGLRLLAWGGPLEPGGRGAEGLSVQVDDRVVGHDVSTAERTRDMPMSLALPADLHGPTRMRIAPDGDVDWSIDAIAFVPAAPSVRADSWESLSEAGAESGRLGSGWLGFGADGAILSGGRAEIRADLNAVQGLSGLSFRLAAGSAAKLRVETLDGVRIGDVMAPASSIGRDVKVAMPIHARPEGGIAIRSLDGARLVVEGLSFDTHVVHPTLDGPSVRMFHRAVGGRERPFEAWTHLHVKIPDRETVETASSWLRISLAGDAARGSDRVSAVLWNGRPALELGPIGPGGSGRATGSPSPSLELELDCSVVDPGGMGVLSLCREGQAEDGADVSAPSLPPLDMTLASSPLTTPVGKILTFGRLGLGRAFLGADDWRVDRDESVSRRAGAALCCRFPHAVRDRDKALPFELLVAVPVSAAPRTLVMRWGDHIVGRRDIKAGETVIALTGAIPVERIEPMTWTALSFDWRAPGPAGPGEPVAVRRLGFGMRRLGLPNVSRHLDDPAVRFRRAITPWLARLTGRFR